MRKIDGFLSFVKGAITGIGSLIPGISSGSLIVSLSSYETFISALKNLFKKDNKKLSLVAIPLLLGIVAGLVGGSHLVTYFLDKFKPQTILLFIGLMVGGYTLIVKNHKLVLDKKITGLFLLVFIFSLLLNILVLDKVLVINSSNILVAIILGIFTGLSVLIPGFSAANLYMLIGKYDYVIESLKNYSELMSVLIGLIFIVCLLISVIVIAKLIYYLLEKYKEKTYVVILALLTSNIIIAIMQIGEFTISFVNIFTSILTFLWGYILAKNVEKE